MSRILFIAVHPDDETLGCGGTILRHNKRGDETFWMILTGVRKHPSGRWSDTDADKRDVIVNKVAKDYGFTEVIDMGFPTTLLDECRLEQLVSAIDSKINEIKPDTVYMMYQNDVHSDHRVAFSAVYSCLKSFRKPYIRRVLMFEALSETEFAVPTPSTSFTPNVFVDITPYIDKKLDIMSIYDTEVMQEPYPRSLSSIKALARVRGSRAGVMYAEAFQLLFEKS